LGFLTVCFVFSLKPQGYISSHQEIKEGLCMNIFKDLLSYKMYIYVYKLSSEFVYFDFKEKTTLTLGKNQNLIISNVRQLSVDDSNQTTHNFHLQRPFSAQ
jgi:hypothetical protein